jgi:hypothetical protein
MIVSEGKQVTLAVTGVKAADTLAYANGVATVQFYTQSGTELADDAVLASSTLYTAKLTYGEGDELNFKVAVNTTSAHFTVNASWNDFGGENPAPNGDPKTHKFVNNAQINSNGIVTMKPGAAMTINVTPQANNPAATYYYSVDNGTTWKVLTPKADGTLPGVPNIKAPTDPGATTPYNLKYKSVTAGGMVVSYNDYKFTVKITAYTAPPTE